MKKVRKSGKKYSVVVVLCMIAMIFWGKQVKVYARDNAGSTYKELFGRYTMAAVLSDEDGVYPYEKAYFGDEKDTVDAVTVLNYTALAMKNLNDDLKTGISFENFCEKYVYSNQYGRFSKSSVSVERLRKGAESTRGLASPLFTYDKIKDEITIKNETIKNQEMSGIFLGCYRDYRNGSNSTILYGVWKNVKFPEKIYGYIALELNDDGEIFHCYEVKSNDVEMDVEIYEDDFDSHGEPDGEIVYTIGDSKKEVVLPCQKKAYSQYKVLFENHEISVEDVDIRISSENKELIRTERSGEVPLDSISGKGKIGKTNITCTVKLLSGETIFIKSYPCILYQLSIFKNGAEYKGEEFKVAKNEKVTMTARLKGLENYEDIFNYHWWVSSSKDLTNVRGKSIEFTALRDSNWDKIKVSVLYKGKVHTTTEEELKIKIKTQNLKKGTVINDKKTNAVYKVTGNSSVQYNKSTKKVKVVTIPADITVNGIRYKVTSIAAKAFANNKKIKKVTIPTSIKSIGKQAFSGCKNLKTIIIKTKYLTKKSVGAKAFKGIHAKAKITVPKKQKKAYQKLLKTKGIGKKVKIR